MVRTSESKETRRKLEPVERQAVYFLKKPPSWSIMPPLLPLWLGGGPP